MRKKLLLKYVLIGLPFVFGSIMFSLGIYNIISSLLFFIGGYVFIKNIFDYRKIRKNKDIIMKKYENVIINNNTYSKCDDVPIFRRSRIRHRVRKRVKNIDF